MEYFDRRTIHGQASPEEGLRLSRDGVVEFNRGTILAEQALTLDGHPGREITIERPDAITIRTRLYAVNDRMYVLYTDSAKERAFSKDAERFLISFRLLAK